MVAFNLPKNSKIINGFSHKASSDAIRVKTFKVYRFDPDSGKNPRLDSFEVDLDKCGPMVLDALLKIKNEIGGLLFAKPLNCSIDAASLFGKSNNAAKAAIPIKE